MKCNILLTLLFVSSGLYANNKNPCDLEIYFQKTESYKSSIFDNETKKLEINRERTSLLPSINVNIGQQNSNNKSFKGLMDSSLSIGISHELYSGNSYAKYKDKFDKEMLYNDLMIDEKKNQYIINLYRNIIEYRYKTDLYYLYLSQLEQQKIQLKASEALLTSGNIAKIEFDITELRTEELQDNIDYLKNDIRQLELDIESQFNVPHNKIQTITSEMILSCKRKGGGNILNEGRELLLQSELANHNLRKTSLLPSIGLSLHMQPPVNGTLNEFSLRKSEFAAGIYVNIPISAFFDANNIKKEHAIAVSKINVTYDEKKKQYNRELENVINKINTLQNRIKLTQKSIRFKGKEVDYMLTRLREKKETIMSYYRQLDEFEREKINLKKDEREYEFYKTYISILD